MRYVLAALLWLIPSMALANVITADDATHFQDLSTQLYQLQQETIRLGQTLPFQSKEQFCAFGLVQDFTPVIEGLSTTRVLSWIASGMQEKTDEQRVLTVLKQMLPSLQKGADLARLRLSAKIGDCSSSPEVVAKAKAGLGLIESAFKLYGDLQTRL